MNTSPYAALTLLRAASVNNGGGLPDCDHLYHETDCEGRRCQSDEGEACRHSYLGARDSAETLGWITVKDDLTDKGALILANNP